MGRLEDRCDEFGRPFSLPDNMVINPNQPRPVALASRFNPPPVWPLPQVDWIVPPAVPPGFPTGPFPPEDQGPRQPFPLFADLLIKHNPHTPGTELRATRVREDFEPLSRRQDRLEDREERREGRREFREDRREFREDRREERRDDGRI